VAIPGLAGLANWLRKQIALQETVSQLNGAIRYQQRVIESQAYRIVRLEIELQQLLGRKLIAKLPPVDPIADEHPDD
jgi:hypothetical protein